MAPEVHFLKRLFAEASVPAEIREVIDISGASECQIYLYLGMLGVPAPLLYSLTSEQVRARGSIG